MTSPQENYTYEQLVKYRGAARRAVQNFLDRYPNLRTEIWQPEQQVATDLQVALNSLRSRIAEMNAYLEPEEFDGIHIGTYSNKEAENEVARIERGIGRLQARFKTDLDDLIKLYEIELKGLYMAHSRLTAKFTADRIAELHRLEEWLATQEHYYALYHYKKVWQYSPLTGFGLNFAQTWRDVPESSGIYILFMDGEIVYIGISGNMQERLLSHEVVRKHYCKNEHGTYIIDCVTCELDEDYMHEIEKEMIFLANPKFNSRSRDK